ncbi:50S ribosomal protein L25 [Candidatus Bipolaricaulota bacterium]|nr:50S ribosomal protein L25 [Candidatus Bipolaricaulota bacterium]
MRTLEAMRRDSDKNPNSLRYEGKLPAVLYGPDRDTVSLTIDKKELSELMKEITRSTRLQLELEDDSHSIFLKDIQYDHLKDKPVHVDFYEVADDHEVEMEIPIVTVGTPEGVHSGGILDTLMETITVRGRAEEIPAIIRLDVEELQIGDSIHVSDLDLGGLKPQTPQDRAVLSILSPRKEIKIDLTEPTIGEELLAEEEELEEAAEELEEGEEVEGEEGEEAAEEGEAEEGEELEEAE